MRLRDYLDAKGLSNADFAALLGRNVTERAVRKWRYHETVPRVPELVRIEEVTEGAVTTRDFVVELHPVGSAGPEL